MKHEANPFTKVGVNYKAKLREELLEQAAALDILEVTTEKLFIAEGDPVLHALIKKLPISLHGLDMSLGSSAGLEPEYLRNLGGVLSNYSHEWFSDHLSLTVEGGIQVGHLMPIQLSEKTLESAVDKIRTVQRLTDRPFLVENITYYYPIPGSDMSEAMFISALSEQTDCGLLLDVNNLYINAENHGFSPEQYLQSIPLDRVVEVHLAGGSRKFGMLVDTHAANVWNEVWELFDRVCQITRPQAVIVERDANFGPFKETLTELNRVRDILSRYGLCKRPGSTQHVTSAV